MPEDEGIISGGLEQGQPMQDTEAPPPDEGHAAPPEGKEEIPEGREGEKGLPPKKEPAPEFKPKHKTWEETERARSELEKNFTKTNQEVSRLRRMMEKVLTPKQEAVESEEDKITKRAWEDIGRIPENDPEHDLKVMKTWGKAQRDIADLRYETKSQESRARDARRFEAESQAKALGLNKDYELRAFWAAAHLADPEMPMEEQIEATVKQVMAWKAEVRKEFEAEIEEKQKQGKVLQRGTPNRKPGEGGEEEGRETTLAEQLKTARRKISLKDLS